ncbi:hypothetical protein JVU11DRAFT_1357 [Chiua virens]|nr:hypothetical protein JVU11DRAFT_1357 [Chiua virens]
MPDHDWDSPGDYTLHRQDSQGSGISQKQSRRPTVHYPEELDHAPSGQYFNTPPKLDSRASSFVGTDDEDHDDGEFDWSGDEPEDLADEEAKFGVKMGVKLRKRRRSVWRLFTILFSSLIGSVFLAGILVTPALLVHFFWYKPHPTSHRHYVTQNVEAWLFWAAVNVVISWGLAMVVDIIPPITRLLISISWGHVSEVVKSHIELYNSVKDTFKPVLYAASAWLSWIILFQNIFNLYNTAPDVTSPAAYTDRVSQTIEFLFFFALVICTQRMLSHAIAFGFHQTAYKERLEEVRLGLHVIETLRNYKPKVRHNHDRSSGGHSVFNLSFMHSFGEKDSNHYQQGDSLAQGCDDGDDADTEDNKGKGKQKPTDVGGPLQPHDSSPSPELEDSTIPRNRTLFHPSHESQDTFHVYPPSQKRAVDHHTHQQEEYNPAIQAARAIKTAVLHDARNIKGTEDDPSDLMFSVTSAHEAKLERSTRRSYDRHRTYLIPEDFRPAFVTSEETQEAFRVFDKDGNGDISRTEIKATILRIYKERRLLSRSMRDVGVALKTLNHILLLFAFIIQFFISLSIFGVDITKSLTSVYTLGVAASFIFKNAASSMFDAIIFLFVTHPFDTGDRCFIETDNLIVKRMGLFATLFFITNVRRSDKMVELLTMQVAWRTPLEKLDALEKHLNEWLATEEKRWFQPTTSIILQNISFQRHLEITITIPHNSDWGLHNTRRTAFHAAVQHYCRQLDIAAQESPLPLVYLDSDVQVETPAKPGTEYRSQNQLGVEGSFLGFTPPEQRGSQLRARKTKSRKAALQGIVLLVRCTSSPMSQLEVADLHDLELIWPSLGPTDVIATGTFDQWSRSIHLAKGDIGFHGTVKVPWGEKIAYKFIVDGRWEYREDRPQEDDGHGNINNILRTPEKPVVPPAHDPPARLSIPLQPGAQSDGQGDAENMVTALELVTVWHPTPVSESKLDSAVATEGTVPASVTTSFNKPAFTSYDVSTSAINHNGSVSLPPINGDGEIHDSRTPSTSVIQLTQAESPTSSSDVPETAKEVVAPQESAVSQPSHSTRAAPDTPLAAVSEPTANQPKADPATVAGASTSSAPSAAPPHKKRPSLFARIKHMFDKNKDKREKKEKSKR